MEVITLASKSQQSYYLSLLSGGAINMSILACIYKFLRHPQMPKVLDPPENEARVTKGSESSNVDARTQNFIP